MATEAWTRYLAYGKEVTYGTGVAPTKVIDIIGESLSPKHRRAEIEPERLGVLERVVETEHQVDGASVDLLPDFIAMGHWLWHLFGTPTTTNPATGAYQHEWYHDPQHVPGSLTLDTYPDINVYRQPGAFGRTLKLGTEQARHFVMTVGLMAAEQYDIGNIPLVDEALFPTPLAPGSPGGPTFALALTAGGFAISGAGQLTMDFAWGRSFRRVERSLAPVGILSNGRVRVGGSLRWFFDTSTTLRHDAFIYLAQLALTASWTGSLIAGGVYNKLELYVPNAFIPQGRGPNVRGPGGVGTLDLDTEFVGRAHSAFPNSSPFRIRLTSTAADPSSF